MKKLEILFLLLVFSCNDGVDETQKHNGLGVESIRETQHVLPSEVEDFCIINFGFEDNLSGILILTEKGCINCNRKFAMLVEELIHNDNVGIVINAQGSNVDISPFIEYKDRSNLVFDRSNLIKELNLKNSSIAVVKDTLIYITAKSLEQDFQYLRDALN